MAFEMTRDARKSPKSGAIPRSRALTRQVDVSSIVLRIGQICTAYIVTNP
jgi:hypothetical protein